MIPHNISSFERGKRRVNGKSTGRRVRSLRKRVQASVLLLRLPFFFITDDIVYLYLSLIVFATNVLRQIYVHRRYYSSNPTVLRELSPINFRSMTMFNLKEIGEQLNEAGSKNAGTGVSFAGRSLKLDTEKDAEAIVEAIKNCKDMEYLDLEGNTLGIEAAGAISKALETHGTALKRALWKDMFTGRMKTEIPKALEYLGGGLCSAGTRLVELDLSDNAFGPIGVKSLAAFLSSPTCYTLQELRLNNNGLGVSGGKMLAEALLDCHAKSSKEATPLALKVFIAGRNRLENEGATALASVFAKLRSLEEVVMPQNGIYHVGIAALANGLSANHGLRILNLNDNTVGLKGARAIAGALTNFQCLETLNLGDCLIKTKGAVILADALGVEGSHASLMELVLSQNEIRARAVDALARAVADKSQLTSLQLDGNSFGNEGVEALREYLMGSDRIEALGTLEEDESADEEESDDEVANEESENESEDGNDEPEEPEDVHSVEDEEEAIITGRVQKKVVNVGEFLKAPTGENFLLLQGDRTKLLLEHAKSLSQGDNSQEEAKYAEELSRIVMKVSALCGSGYGDVRVEAERITDSLYSELFSYAKSSDQSANVDNTLLVNLGLLKSEDKSANKIDWNLEGCFKALEIVSQKDYFPSQTKDALKVFIARPPKPGKTKFVDPLLEAKNSLKAILDRLQNT